MEAQRALLDQLMGPNRNGTSTKRMKYSDEQVCKPFLLGMCPSDMLVNTKSDIGPCPAHHSEALKKDFERAVEAKDEDLNAYLPALMLALEPVIRDCDRKINRVRQRLQIHLEDDGPGGDEEETQEVQKISDQVDALHARAEELGSQGKVEESLKVMEEAAALSEKRDTLKMVMSNSAPTDCGTSNQHKLRVCEVCAASLSIYDSAERLAEHFRGRMHNGFKDMREKLQELRTKGVRASMERRRSRSPPARTRSRDDRSRGRDHREREYPGGLRRYRDEPRDRDRDRDRGGYREPRDYRDRDRDRDRAAGFRDRRDSSRDRGRGGYRDRRY